MEENIPLLASSKQPNYFRRGTTTDSRCSRCNSHSQLNDVTISVGCCQRIFYCLSGCMLNNPKLLLRIKYVFWIILANGLIACLFILVMKLYDPVIFWRWSNGYLSVLGNWNLQIADCLLVLTYALTDFLQLRICLSIACISFVIYSIRAPVGVMADMGMFNIVMALLNIRHAVVLVYKKRYIEFAEEMEQIYTTLFSQYMTRVQFKELSDISLIRSEKARVAMKKEGDLVTSLCILVKGQVEVRRGGRLLNVLCKNEILEAPEWVKTNLNPEGTRFTLSFVTATDVIYVKFTRELLAGILEKDPTIRSAFLAVLGIRVSELWLRSLDRKVDRTPSSNPRSTFNESDQAPNPRLLKVTESYKNQRTLRAQSIDDRLLVERLPIHSQQENFSVNITRKENECSHESPAQVP